MDSSVLRLTMTLVLAVALGAAVLLFPDADDASLDTATAELPLVLDYALWIVDADGSERLAETTRYDTARAANASDASYRLWEEARYVPRVIERANLTAPRAVAEFVLAALDPALLAPGRSFDVTVEDAMGADEDLEHGEVERRVGPFPREYSLTRAEYVAATGTEPRVGARVNTSAHFTATVDAVEKERVHLSVPVADGDRIVSNPLASVFIVDVAEDGGEFHLVLSPVKDTVFRLASENRVLGLAPGNYLWSNVTETTAAYVAHPSVSPVFAGLDFRIEAAVIE